MSFRPQLFDFVRCAAGACLALACLLSPASAATSGRRLALVIGNGGYQSVPQLPNARNDADATAVLLAEARFDVTRAADADLSALRGGVERFAAAVESAGPGALVVVYYAGHAVQLNGNNHLLPVDIRPSASEDVPAQSVTLGEILKRLDRTGAAAKIVILDACRDNPFDRAVAPARGLAVALLDNPGKAEAGLARVESAGGTFVAFATSPGASAADGAGEHSPFTEAFLRHARAPGAPIESVFREVRLSVHAATDGRQIPWETSSLTTSFSFFEGPKEPAPSLALAAAETGSSTSRGGLDLGPEPTRESLAAMAPRDAYTLVIAWDRPEFYRLFLEVHGEDPLAMRVYRILSARVEEMSWAMAARWGDPAHLRRYAAVFAGSAHAMEARAMAAAGGAPAAKVAAICTPGAPKGIVDPAPVLRKASLVPPPRRTVTLRAAPRPRPRPAALPEVEEVESSGAPVHGARSVTVGPFGPGIVGPRRPLPLPPFGEPGRPLRADGGPRPPRQPVPAGPATALPPDYSPGFARFIDAGRTRAGVPPTEPGPIARPSRPFLSPGESGGLR